MTAQNSVIKQGFQTPDGIIHDSMREANNHLRKPKIEAALTNLVGDNKELTAWMIANMDGIEGVFESNKIQRVTKSERNQLEKALNELTQAHATVAEDGTVSNIEKKVAFVIENKQAILDSFRWPSVKRGSEEEQAAKIKEGFLELTTNNAEVTDWLIANKDAILEAFQAGIVKRPVNEKASTALAEYRAMKAAEKAAKAAAQPAQPAV